VVIDLSLHNIGHRVANVTRIELEDVIQHLDMLATEYPLELKQDSNELIFSHALPPDELDRIVIRVHPSTGYAGKHVTAELRVKYNRTCWTAPELLEFTCPGKS